MTGSLYRSLVVGVIAVLAVLISVTGVSTPWRFETYREQKRIYLFSVRKRHRRGPDDDSKLLRLSRMKSGGINPLFWDASDIEAVQRLAHLPEIHDKTFANRFRENTRDFCFSHSQDGHRARKLLIALLLQISHSLFLSLFLDRF